MKRHYKSRMGRYLALVVTCAVLAQPGVARAQDEEPMLGSYDSFWGSLGLQYRLRLEVRENADLDFGETDTILMALQRVRLHVDLNYADWLEGYVQLQDSRALGYGNSSLFYDGNSDLHQAWSRITVAKIFFIKLGRQELVYGDQRLIGPVGWSNVGRVFDAAKLWVDYGLGHIDAFAAVFTPESSGDLTRGTWFMGLYNSMGFLRKTIVWEQYVLGLVDSPGAMDPGTVRDPELEQGPGPERNLVTLGTRLRMSGGGVDASIEGAYQTGYHYAGYGGHGEVPVDQNAYALHGDFSYAFDVPTKPYLRVEVNHASGNKEDTSRHWHRFNNLFPTNHPQYGYMDLMAWSSSLSGSVGFGMRPHSILALRLDYWILARGSKHDGWYSASGKELAPPPDPDNPTNHDDEMLLGHEVDLTVNVMVNRHLKILSGFGAFVPRGYARVRGSSVQLWAYSMLIVGF